MFVGGFPMSIGSILIKKAIEKEGYPQHDLQEIALVGRSNVGKSSLINTLIQRRGFAAISSSPGKTRAIHFYSLNRKVALVDLPGYGYAKVSKEMKKNWSLMIEEYLYSRENLAAIIHIVDARHPPSQGDILMGEWLAGMDFPVLLVATKVDKISKGSRGKQEGIIKKALHQEKKNPFLFFSAISGEGRREVLLFISSLGDAG